MKAAVVYWSGTGNTAALHKICRKLTGECLPMALLLLALALR